MQGENTANDGKKDDGEKRIVPRIVINEIILYMVTQKVAAERESRHKG